MQIKNSQIRATILIMAASSLVCLGYIEDGFEKPLDDLQQSMNILISFEQVLKSVLSDEKKEHKDKQIK